MLQLLCFAVRSAGRLVLRDVWYLADEDNDEAVATRRERNAGDSDDSQTGLTNGAEADADTNGSARKHGSQSPDGREEEEGHVGGDGAEEAPRKKTRILDDDE